MNFITGNITLKQPGHKKTRQNSDQVSFVGHNVLILLKKFKKRPAIFCKRVTGVSIPDAIPLEW